MCLKKSPPTPSHSPLPPRPYIMNAPLQDFSSIVRAKFSRNLTNFYSLCTAICWDSWWVALIISYLILLGIKYSRVTCPYWWVASLAQPIPSLTWVIMHGWSHRSRARWSRTLLLISIWSNSWQQYGHRASVSQSGHHLKYVDTPYKSIVFEPMSTQFTVLYLQWKVEVGIF